jgi:hypothetical protein
MRSIRFERAIPTAAVTALTGNRLDRETTSAAAIFFGLRLIESLFQDLDLEGLLSKKAMELTHLLL